MCPTVRIRIVFTRYCNNCTECLKVDCLFLQQYLQDPNADTEWNDVLRAKGIIPEKQEQEITEDDIVGMLEQTIEKKASGKSPIHVILQS